MVEFRDLCGREIRAESIAHKKQEAPGAPFGFSLCIFLGNL
jgi:hypothetical protein